MASEWIARSPFVLYRQLTQSPFGLEEYLLNSPEKPTPAFNELNM